MNKLRVIKSKLKKEGLWNEYKEAFDNKNMKLLISKVALIFNQDADVETLFEKEKEMLKATHALTEDMFVKAFKGMDKITNEKARWEDFAKFMFFVYQTSTFKHDNKKGDTTNIFITSIINANTDKRTYFTGWEQSLDYSKAKTNLLLMEVMRLVF